MQAMAIMLLTKLGEYLLRPAVLEAVGMWAIRKAVKHSKSKWDNELLAAVEKAGK